MDRPYPAVADQIVAALLRRAEATRLIRQYELDHGLEPVPVVGLSARAMAGDRDIALDAGMDDYLTKPLRTTALQEALDRWIGKAVVVTAP